MAKVNIHTTTKLSVRLFILILNYSLLTVRVHSCYATSVVLEAPPPIFPPARSICFFRSAPSYMNEFLLVEPLMLPNK